MTENWDTDEFNSDFYIQQQEHKGKITRMLDDMLEKNMQEERKYIGASSIGHPCERKIWYGFNGIQGEPISSELQRTFDIGKTLESLVLSYMQKAGMLLTTDTGQYCDRSVAEFKGSPDAIWYGTKHDDALETFTQAIIEIKTAKHSSFGIFTSKGVKIWYPVYYAQVQAYMGMSGITKAYVVVLDKDTSKMADECIEFDPAYYDELKTKAARIVDAKIVPPKLNNNPCYFVCRSCQYKTLCHS